MVFRLTRYHKSCSPLLLNRFYQYNLESFIDGELVHLFNRKINYYYIGPFNEISLKIIIYRKL